MTMFCPATWQDTAYNFKKLDIYPWMQNFLHRRDIFCSFWSNWQTPNLPAGYDFYLVTYHIENIDIEWLKNQKVEGKIVVIFPGNDYNLSIPNVVFIGYTELHNDISRIVNWHGIKNISSKKKYKFSTICNRVTQGKIWTTTQILESESNSLVILNPNWIEEKNVHNWEPTGVRFLDELTDKFKTKYINLVLSDNFNQSTDNNQKNNSTPWQPYYTDTALHIVAGSFHYSYMGDYTYPGPDIDEKTLKCLIAGTAFLPAMQFDVYNYLTRFGLQFEYKFDTSFDSDPGNLTRFQKICILIDQLSKWTIDEILSATSESSAFNQEHILNGNFAKACNNYNALQVEKIFKALQ